MISENLLFTSFVHGMPSGLVEEKNVQMDDERLPADEVVVSTNSSHDWTANLS